MDAMGWLAWIIVGAVVGWLASAIVSSHLQRGLLIDLVVGIVGSIVGGLLFFWLVTPGQTAFNIWSLLVALIGAVILLGLERLFVRPNIPTD